MNKEEIVIVRCIKVKYHALGMEHFAYADCGFSIEDAKGLIKQICDTAIVESIGYANTTEKDFLDNSVSKIAQHLEDLEKYENTTTDD